MSELFGIPVADTADLRAFFRSLGITEWPVVEALPMEDYVAGALTPEQKAEVARFAPKSMAVQLTTPDGRPFTGFFVRVRVSVCAAVFHEGNVLVVGEYKAGGNTVTVMPPGGVVAQKHMEAAGGSLERAADICAEWEVSEETGFPLKVTRLCGPTLMHSRSTDAVALVHLGILEEPVKRGPARLDDKEFVKPAWVPVDLAFQAIEAGQIDMIGAMAIMLALKRLGRLRFSD